MVANATTHHPFAAAHDAARASDAPSTIVGPVTHAALTTRITRAARPAQTQAPAPTLDKALFKLTAALTYEDFADAVETFCDATLPHDSRAISVGYADYLGGDCTSLVDHILNVPLPGAALIDPGLRMHLIRPDAERFCATPGVPVWHDRNSLPAFDPDDARGYYKTAFFRHVAEPEGWLSNLCVPLWIGGNIHSLFWIKRAEGRPHFTDAEARLVEHYHPWLLATLKRISLLEENRAHKHDITHSLLDIPVPTFLLDWNLRVVQRNAAAEDACAAWQLGPKAARATKPPFLCAERVPPEIAAACREMKTLWSAQFPHHNETPPPPAAAAATHAHGIKQRLKIAHPANPRMEATITLLRPSALRLAHPSFLVRIHETAPDTASAAAGNAELLIAPPDPATTNATRMRLLAQLTQAEREIVPLVARGMSDKEIAAALCKSVPTIKNQLHSIYEKLRVPNRAGLTAALR